MPNYLNIPDELQSLIEKRERDDRRAAERLDEDDLVSNDVPCSERRLSERRSATPRREGTPE
ncbi:MAG TPA: hypothetical protein VMM76_27715 [Pirellulaceae bacterium]|nr:hypothetical protein [Pirellulaceae bacterium]